MWALNLKIKPYRETIKHRLFSRQSLQAASHQHDWRNQRWRKMTCCGAWGEGRCPSWITVQQIELLSMTTAFCYSSLTSRLVLTCTLKKREPYFTLLFTYSCNNPQCSYPSIFILIFHSIYEKGLCGTLCRQRVMNKLRRKMMVESYSEVACISLPLQKNCLLRNRA